MSRYIYATESLIHEDPVALAPQLLNLFFDKDILSHVEKEGMGKLGGAQFLS